MRGFIGIWPKVNVIALLVFEIVLYDVVVYHVSQYATWTHLLLILIRSIVTTVLIRQLIFLIPGFMSANFQFELITRDTFSFLLVLFLSYSFFSPFFFLQHCILCVCVSTRAPVSVYGYILPDFSLYYSLTGTLAQRLECSPMARETWIQSQVESYQRL